MRALIAGSLFISFGILAFMYFQAKKERERRQIEGKRNGLLSNAVLELANRILSIFFSTFTEVSAVLLQYINCIGFYIVIFVDDISSASKALQIAL